MPVTPATQEAEAEASQVHGQSQQLSEALSNLVRPCFKIKNTPGVVVLACNPSTWEAETGESQVHSQSQKLSEALSNLVRPCFKIKNKIGPGV